MSRFSNFNYLIITRAAGLVCLLSLGLLSARCLHPILDAKQKVSIGMSREEAVQILSREAWYYQPCIYGSRIDDLFFFGSHRYDDAAIVIVESQFEDGGYRVTLVGSDENYIWQKVYRDCIDMGRFEKS